METYPIRLPIVIGEPEWCLKVTYCNWRTGMVFNDTENYKLSHNHNIVNLISTRPPRFPIVTGSGRPLNAHPAIPSIVLERQTTTVLLCSLYIPLVCIKPLNTSFNNIIRLFESHSSRAFIYSAIIPLSSVASFPSIV